MHFSNVKPGIIICLICFVSVIGQAQKSFSVKSPNGNLKVQVNMNGGKINYSILSNGKTIVHPSPLGLVTEDDNFSQGLSFISATTTQKVTDQYKMVNAKKHNISYKA